MVNLIELGFTVDRKNGFWNVAILDTGINCDFRSFSSLAPLRLSRSRFNAKLQGRKDAKGIISVVTSVVVIQPTIKKSSICGGAKYNATVFESFS